MIIKTYIIEKVFHSMGYPILEFAKSTFLQQDYYNDCCKLNFNKCYNTAKKFNTETEALTFIRNAIINNETTEQNNLFNYNIIECGNRLNRLCLKV